MDDAHQPSHPVQANERDGLQAIGKKIKEARGGHSQRWLADMVGTTQASIRRLERGETTVSVVLLARTAKVLDLEIPDLVVDFEPAVTLVERSHKEHQEYIEQRTSSMGLGELDFYTKRTLLRLLDLWPD